MRDDHVTLTANAGYWRGKPKVGRMIRKVVKDNVVAAAQLRSGELDWAIVQPESFDDLRSDPHLNVIQYGNSTVNYIAYNLDRPLFQDKRVRQALAGWSAGADGILRKGGLPLRFGLATNAGNKAREGVLTIAQDQWRKIGIDVQQQLLQLNAINDKLQKTRDFDAVLAQLVPGVDPDQTSFWSSKEFPAGQNYAHYSDPTVDQLLAQGRTVAGCDESARKSIYDRLQLSLAEDQPVTLLYQPVTLIAHDRRLRGIAPTPYARPQWNFAEWNWGA